MRPTKDQAQQAVLSAFPAAFRFFMPAWILADLHGDGFNTDPVFHLTYGIADWDRPPDTDTVEHCLSKLSSFSAPERAALAAYLRHNRAKPGLWDRTARQIDQALERFWEKLKPTAE